MSAESPAEGPRKKAKVEMRPAALSLSVLLSDGARMPRVGFGTYKLKGPEVTNTVATALGRGYGLIDTAHVYGGGKTEPLVGAAVRHHGGAFVVTKQWRGFHGYDETLKCIRQSHSRLNVGTINLILMHWPGPGYSAMGRSKARIASEGIKTYWKKGHEDLPALRLETWRAMEDAVGLGLCASIGVANFSTEHVSKLLAWPDIRIRPVVNQIEVHPYLQQRELVELCHRENIVVQAYASLGGQDSSKKDWEALGRPPLLEHPAVVAAASKHGVSAAAVLLRWALQKDYCIIPKSRDATRIDANAQLDFALLDDEMAALDALDCGGMAGRLCWRRDEMRMLDFP